MQLILYSKVLYFIGYLAIFTGSTLLQTSLIRLIILTIYFCIRIKNAIKNDGWHQPHHHLLPEKSYIATGIYFPIIQNNQHEKNITANEHWPAKFAAKHMVANHHYQWFYKR
ncbi:hypothetical protein [Hydrotalea sp.]|uniref:hypothetical protein n=1 Tax=Hydrotalea sp. TaxID=2881279 RepID=UPI00261BAFC0|nr:hypothetical protein [Hydrotalea sp.]